MAGTGGGRGFSWRSWPPGYCVSWVAVALSAMGPNWRSARYLRSDIWVVGAEAGDR